MPGGDLLFRRLSDSTIGAVWFHGRVRDGIGWVTDAMATKQWSQRGRILVGMRWVKSMRALCWLCDEPHRPAGSVLMLMVGLFKRE